MRRLLLLVSWFVAGMSAAIDLAAVTDDAVAQAASEVLHRVGSLDEYERAAFIVREADGTVSVLHWPNAQLFRTARWTGPVPEGVVAIIHSHPRKRPKPSRQDAVEARRLQLPFYVVSRASLWVVEPSGRVRSARILPWLRDIGITYDVQLELKWQDRAQIRM